MIRNTDSMLKASALQTLLEDIADCQVSLDAAKAAAVDYAIEFFETMIVEKTKRADWLRENLTNPGC